MGHQVRGKWTPPYAVASRSRAAWTPREPIGWTIGQRLVLRALAEAARGDEAGQSEHVIGVAMGDRQPRRREHAAAERQLQSLAGVHDQLQRLVPQPVAVHAPGEADEIGVHVHDGVRTRRRLGRRRGLTAAFFFAAENTPRGVWPARGESGTRYGPEQRLDVGLHPLVRGGVLAERAPGEQRAAHHGDDGPRQALRAAVDDLAFLASVLEQPRHLLFEGGVVALGHHAELRILEAELKEGEQVGQLLRFLGHFAHAVADFGDGVQRRCAVEAAVAEVLGHAD